MFERYTELARRTLFFARYEATQLGGTSIEPEHVLLGLLRESGPVVGPILLDADASGSETKARRQLTTPHHLPAVSKRSWRWNVRHPCSCSSVRSTTLIFLTRRRHPA
jgi:hypothetical protein